MKNRDLELATTTLKVVEEKGFEKDLPVEVSQASIYITKSCKQYPSIL